MLADFLHVLLRMTLCGSAACLVLLVLNGTVLRRCGGRLAYTLWLLPLLLFVLPIRVEVPLALPQAGRLGTSLLEQPAPAAVPIEQLADTLGRGADGSAPPETESGARRAPGGLSIWLFCLWAAGAGGWLFWCLFSYLRYQYRVTHYGCLPVEQQAKDALGQVKRGMGVRRRVRLVCSGSIQTPLATGFFYPSIILPPCPLEEAEYQLMFRHELTHIKRGDIWYKLLASAVCALHWFNPLCHLMVRRIHENCEYACDESVTAHMQSNERRQYGEMMLKMLCFHTLAPVFVSHLAKNKTILKRRFDEMMKPQKRNKVVAAIAAAAVCLSAVLPALAWTQPKQFSRTTYYNVNYDMAYNVNSTLGLPTGEPPHGGTFVRVIEGGVYLDGDGYDTVTADGNCQRPVLYVESKWQAKGAEIPAGTVVTQENVEGYNLEVRFSPQAAAYADNPVIEKMLQNRFTRELHYTDPLGKRIPEFNYDHPAYIKALMQQGVFCITSVLEPEQFQPLAQWASEDGGVFTYEVQSAANGLDAASQISKQTLTLYENTDGNQGKAVVQQVTVPAGKTLSVDIQTDQKINVAFVNQGTGETVGWMPNLTGGIRYSYQPGGLAGQAFQIRASTEEPGSVQAEIAVYLQDKYVALPQGQEEGIVIQKVNQW